MYFKLALSNVKKSFKDYSIYFLTLTLAVCIFYSFNSIESQKAVLELSKAESKSIDMMMQIISIISVFVSFILGSLIIYANNFLVKKRKKELGIYMSLGMSKSKISKILVIETFLVGVLSLISGLLLGIILSQGLSVFTSKLFEVPMSEYNFIISYGSIGKTIVYFGIIFILVMLFNTRVISKYKIIDLLTSSRKNEQMKVRNSFVYVVCFILSVLSIGYAYYLVTKSGLDMSDIRFKISILLGIVGTFTFFFSLAGFLLNVVRKSQNIYFKELNIFILNQLNSKVKTNFMSMSVICLMLFLTIGMLSTGLGFKDSLEDGLEKTTPFDVTITKYLDEDSKVKSVEDGLNNIGFKFENGEKYASYNEYRLDETIADSLGKYLSKKDRSALTTSSEFDINLITISDYNKIRKLKGEEALSIKNNEVLLTSNNTSTVNALNSMLKYNDKIDLGKKVYNIKNEKVITEAIRTSGLTDNVFTLVVNDNMVKNLEPSATYLNINYDESNKEKSEEKITKAFENRDVYDDKGEFMILDTKLQLIAESKGLTTTILFVGIYLGIVFLISSMAVLSLQQLSEASDSIDRYKSLKRIGANDKMINKSIFIQTLIYFTLPLALAFIHSLVAINVINDFISMFGRPNILASSLMTVLIFGVVYIGYFYSTYIGYKNIVKNS